MTWTWTPHLHPEVWALCLAILAGYFFLLRSAGRRIVPTGPAASKRQVATFVTGVGVLFVAASWPIHDLAERSLYSVHMTQHMLISLVAPPLLMLGTPGWMARLLLPAPLLRVVRFLSRPLVALAVFNTVFVFTHWPAAVSASVGSELVHFSLHTLVFFSAVIMWMPVASPLLEIPRLSYPSQMVYLFLQSLVPTIPASFLTFGDRPLYHVYEAFSRPWGMSALEDQRAAGLIMKIVGGAILWGVTTALFFKWFKMEHTEGVDALEWHDVDRTMNRMELTKR